MMLRRESFDKENVPLKDGNARQQSISYPESKQASGRTSPYLLRATPPSGAPKARTRHFSSSTPRPHSSFRKKLAVLVPDTSNVHTPRRTGRPPGGTAGTSEPLRGHRRRRCYRGERSDALPAPPGISATVRTHRDAPARAVIARVLTFVDECYSPFLLQAGRGREARRSAPAPVCGDGPAAHRRSPARRRGGALVRPRLCAPRTPLPSQCPSATALRASRLSRTHRALPRPPQ